MWIFVEFIEHLGIFVEHVGNYRKLSDFPIKQVGFLSDRRMKEWDYMRYSHVKIEFSSDCPWKNWNSDGCPIQ